MFPSATNESPPVSDDAWEILRDSRAWFLKQAGQLLREAEPVSEEALAAFAKAIGAYFDEKTTTERRTSFDQLAPASAPGFRCSMRRPSRHCAVRPRSRSKCPQAEH